MKSATARLFIVLAAVGLSAPCARAQDFGRLFFTPEQRAQLDSNFARNATPDSNSGVVMVNGVVQRKGGPRTVWINGVAREAGKSNERNPAAVPVNVPGQNKPVEMKVGQRLLIDNSASAPSDSQ